MTAVTLRRYYDDWQVTRGAQRWTPPVMVRKSFGGRWVVTHRGIGKSSFPTLRDVRAWCESPDGRDWLDSLPGGAA